VARSPLEVADVLNAHGDAYIARHRGHLSRGQLKVMGAIRACRTAALGGHVARCEGCDHVAVAYNSCRNRHCPKCQGQTARAWLARRQADLLRVPYYHVVFTLPAPVAALAFQNKAVVYDLLFRTAAGTLLTIAADPRHLGARIGLTAVLHTWGSALTHHPTSTSWCPAAGSPRTGRAGSLAAPASSCPCGSSPACSAGCSWTGSLLRMAPGGSPSTATSRPSPTPPPSRPISPRCAARSGSSTPSAPSPDPQRCSPTYPATPIGSRSRPVGSSPSTSAA